MRQRSMGTAAVIVTGLLWSPLACSSAPAKNPGSQAPAHDLSAAQLRATIADHPEGITHADHD